MIEAHVKRLLCFKNTKKATVTIARKYFQRTTLLYLICMNELKAIEVFLSPSINCLYIERGWREKKMERKKLKTRLNCLKVRK
jgi:hypothetical protein